MARYRIKHLERLQALARERFDALMAALKVQREPDSRFDEYSAVDGCSVRLAVEDFKTILDEIKKLK